VSDYVDNLISAIIDDAQRGYPCDVDKVIALRKAVIREASVGEIVIEQHEGYMSPDPMFTVGAKSKLQAGEYWLVKKATE